MKRRIIYTVVVFTKFFNNVVYFNNRPTKEQIDEAIKTLAEGTETSVPKNYDYTIVESVIFDIT